MVIAALLFFGLPSDGAQLLLLLWEGAHDVAMMVSQELCFFNPIASYSGDAATHMHSHMEHSITVDREKDRWLLLFLVSIINY